MPSGVMQLAENGQGATMNGAPAKWLLDEENPFKELKAAETKMMSDAVDQILRGDTHNINPSNFVNPSPALLAAVQLVFGEKKNREQFEEFRFYLEQKHQHEIDHEHKHDGEQLTREEFAKKIEFICEQDNQLLDDIRSQEEDANKEVEELQARSLHVHHNGQDILMVRATDGHGYVDFTTGKPIPGVTSQEIKDAIAEFQRTHKKDESIATYPESSEAIRYRQGCNLREDQAQKILADAQAAGKDTNPANRDATADALQQRINNLKQIDDVQEREHKIDQAAAAATAAKLANVDSSPDSAPVENSAHNTALASGHISKIFDKQSSAKIDGSKLDDDATPDAITPNQMSASSASIAAPVKTADIFNAQASPSTTETPVLDAPKINNNVRRPDANNLNN